MSADVVDLAAARERRARMVRLFADAVLLKLGGVDITDHLSLLAEQFPELREVA
jgi:hypothetical protein